MKGIQTHIPCICSIAQLCKKVNGGILQMKILLSQFKKLCHERNYKKYIFSSNENVVFSENTNIEFNCSYYSIDVFLYPETVVLKNDSSNILFDNIKCVNLFETASGTGDLYEITCSFDEKNKSYVIYAEK